MINFNSWKTAGIIILLWFVIGVAIFKLVPITIDNIPFRQPGLIESVIAIATAGIVVIAKSLLTALVLHFLSQRSLSLAFSFSMAMLTFLVDNISSAILTSLNSGGAVLFVSAMFIAIVVVLVLLMREYEKHYNVRKKS